MRSQEYRDRTRSTAATPYASISMGCASSCRIRCASRAGRPGGMMIPVVPSTTASTCPPTGGAMTGVPDAMDCSEVIPEGSYWQVLTTRSGAQQGRHGGVPHLAGEDHAVRDAQRG